MKIFIGADHAGFQFKKQIKAFLTGLGFEVEDLGNQVFDPDDDYPDFIIPVAEAVAQNPDQNRGIVIGGSGQGEAMAANKVKGVRAALVFDEYSAKMSRADNDANVIALGARTLDLPTAKKLLKLWLETSFSHQSRHQRRIKKMEKYG